MMLEELQRRHYSEATHRIEDFRFLISIHRARKLPRQLASRCSAAHHRLFRAYGVRTELDELLVIILNDLARSQWSPSKLPPWLTEERYRQKVQPLLAKITLLSRLFPEEFHRTTYRASEIGPHHLSWAVRAGTP
jgi:hypothetical protein